MNYKLILVDGQKFEFTREEVDRQQKTISNYAGRTFIEIRGVGVIPYRSIIGWFEDGEEEVAVSPQAAGVRSVKNRNCCDSPKIEIRKGRNRNGNWEYREQCATCCKKGSLITVGAVKNPSSTQEFLIALEDYKETIKEPTE